MSKLTHHIITIILASCTLITANADKAWAKSVSEPITPEASGNEEPSDTNVPPILALDAQIEDHDLINAQDEETHYRSETQAETSPDTTALERQSLLITDAFTRASALACAQNLKPLKSTSVLPKNTRQVSEGYWIGSLPSANNVDALYSHRIKLVITATRTKEDLTPLNNRLEELGMKHLMLPFGSKFPKPSRFMSIVSRYAPDRIFIHCDHGGDRSGALLAFLLVKKHNWKLPHALLAVLNPSPTDIKGLTDVLGKRGYTITQSDIDKYLGIYSATTNGGGGGLKVRSDDYKKLLNTMIDMLEK